MYTVLMLIVFNSVSSLRYINYKLIKPFYLDLYNIKKGSTYDLEHIVPQSLYKDDVLIKRDMHNIILYPKKLNNQRSNYKYVTTDTYLDYLKFLDKNGNQISGCIDDECNISNSIMNTFVPETKYKGLIARTCMYFIVKYPKYKNIVLKRVIDPKTIIIWNYKFPPSPFEKEKNNYVRDLQGDLNPFVKDPDSVIDYFI